MRTTAPFVWLRASTRPTIAEIDISAIRQNLRGVRKRVGPDVRIMAVVKANAYGHGITGVSTALEEADADAFGVAFPEEGAELRNAGIRSSIHVFTLPAPTQLPLFIHHDLEATVATVRDVSLLQREAERFGKRVRVHIKVDTGMHRIGARLAELPSLLKALGRSRRIEVKGVFTHFATADERDKSFQRLQLRQFEDALESLWKQGLVPEDVHCANSATILDLPEAAFTMVRPGIMMYGYYPSAETSESVSLKPAMALKSCVAMVKTIERGASVSYGRRYIAKKRTRIATVPIGYADGYSRLLTNRASVLIGGRKRPVAGTICMDQLMVDIGSDDVRPGDEVVVMGRQSNLTITAAEIARTLGTIPYERTCAVTARVPRIYKGL